MSKETTYVVFKNSKLTFTFEHYLYLRHYIQEYKDIGMIYM